MTPKMNFRFLYASFLIFLSEVKEKLAITGLLGLEHHIKTW